MTIAKSGVVVRVRVSKIYADSVGGVRVIQSGRQVVAYSTGIVEFTTKA